MNISSTLLKDFATQINTSEKPSEVTANGTIKVINGEKFVRLDGSDVLTPVIEAVSAKSEDNIYGDRVLVQIKNHEAIIVGNYDRPPTDDTVALDAKTRAEQAATAASNARIAADAASAAATVAEGKADAASAAATVAEGKADAASAAATVAEGKADAASAAAAIADGKADAASAAATVAEGKADAASAAAFAASNAATDAYNAATAAQWQLGAVEDVVGTLEWIATHAIYKTTNDTTPETGKWYYSLTPTLDPEPTVFNLQSGKYYLESDVYTAVENPDDEDLGNYYEYDSTNNVYFLTEDETIDPTKTYYTKKTILVAAPSTSAIDPTKDYYTVVATALNIPADESPFDNDAYEIASYDKTVRDYINTHLALDQNGLHITDGTLTNRIDISQTNGMVMYVAGKQIAKYGPNTIIGDPTNYHIEITAGTPDDPNDPAMLSFVTGNGVKVAYMSGEVLNIPKVVVVDSLQIGKWIWDGQSNDTHLTLRWLGTRQNT